MSVERCEHFGVPRLRAWRRPTSGVVRPPRNSVYPTWERLAFKGALAFVFSLLLGVLEPFGFAEDAAMTRFGFWALMIGAWFVLSTTASLALSALLPLGLEPRLRYAARICVSLGPMMMLATWAAEGVWGWSGVEAVLQRAVQVLAITLTFDFLCHAVLDRKVDRSAGPIGAPRSPSFGSDRSAPARREADHLLIARLPAVRRGDILCLAMEDHYVRVHTTSGSTLVPMRFSDALAAVSGLQGLRVHRSWWIAVKALDKVEGSTRSMRLRLVNGLIVPVSQPYAQAARALGERRDGNVLAVAGSRVPDAGVPDQGLVLTQAGPASLAPSDRRT